MARLKASVKHESEAILQLIFSNYEQARLLFYGSAGSSLDNYFDALVASKIEESLLFFRGAGYAGIDEGLLGLLISVQFDSYRRIVGSCRDRETAENYMQALMTYNLGGWAALFDAANKTREDV